MNETKILYLWEKPCKKKTGHQNFAGTANNVYYKLWRRQKVLVTIAHCPESID